MTNLEYYKDKVVQLFRGDLICNQIYDVISDDKDCKECPFNTDGSIHCNYQKFIDWLLEEHKESIKLKQWEKDLLEVLDSKYATFLYYELLMRMRNIGYFKGITDTFMTIQEILDNCEVVDD